MLRKTAALAFAAAVMAGAADAATLTAQFTGGTGGVGSDAAGHDQDKQISDFVETSTETFISIGDAASASGGFGSGSVSAQLSADAKKGEVKTYLSASRTGAPSDGSTAPIPNMFSDVSMTEEFILNGTGTFTIYALVDAIWSAPQIGFSFNLGIWGAQSSADSYQVDTSGLPGNHDYDSISTTGSVTDHLLKVSVDLWDAQNLSLFPWLQLNASLATWSSPAFLDASHTAQFQFETSAGLTATPTTVGFLEESTFGLPPIAPVPLPAGLPLLGAGLLAFGGFRMRRRG